MHFFCIEDIYISESLTDFNITNIAFRYVQLQCFKLKSITIKHGTKYYVSCCSEFDISLLKFVILLKSQHSAKH
jgi:hypothetical protein